MSNQLLNKLKSEMDNIAFSLVENPAQDFTSYRERVAEYNGLKKAIEIITQAEEEDE